MGPRTDLAAFDHAGGVYESAPFNVSIDISPEDDIPTVRDMALRIDEDSASSGLASGHEITLQLNDSELGQVLASAEDKAALRSAPDKPRNGRIRPRAARGFGHPRPIGLGKLTGPASKLPCFRA